MSRSVAELGKVTASGQPVGRRPRERSRSHGMGEEAGGRPAPLRSIDPPFVAPGSLGVAVRDRLKGLSAEDDRVLRLVGHHLGRLASGDLAVRCADGLEHDANRWAVRKRALTAQTSARWAGSITKATHDQWALARRCQTAHIDALEAGIRTLEHRLSLPVGAASVGRSPSGYRSRREWFCPERTGPAAGARPVRHVAALLRRAAGGARVVRRSPRVRLARQRHPGAAVRVPAVVRPRDPVAGT